MVIKEAKVGGIRFSTVARRELGGVMTPHIALDSVVERGNALIAEFEAQNQ